MYDALNVLKAADIIVQGPGRDLMWKGLPSGGQVSGDHQDDAELRELRTRKRALVEHTKRQLDNVVVGGVYWSATSFFAVVKCNRHGLLTLYITCCCHACTATLPTPPHPQQLIEYQHTLKRVVMRNCEQRPSGLEGSAASGGLQECTIPYPFVLLQTHLQNTVNIQHSDDRMQYDLDFGRCAEKWFAHAPTDAAHYCFQWHCYPNTHNVWSLYVVTPYHFMSANGLWRCMCLPTHWFARSQGRPGYGGSTGRAGQTSALQHHVARESVGLWRTQPPPNSRGCACDVRAATAAAATTAGAAAHATRARQSGIRTRATVFTRCHV